MSGAAWLGLGLAAVLASLTPTRLESGRAPTVRVSSEAPGEELLVKREFGAMGTDVLIEALGSDRALLEGAVDAARVELVRVEDLMTSWRPSPLTRLNDAAGSGPQLVPAELAEMIHRSLELAKLTDGAFDPTFAGVGKLWDFKADPPVLPTPTEVAAAIESVDYTRVRVDLEHHTVDLPAGMRIGLGGIAKGYGVDRAMAVLMKHGVQSGLVSAGGDLKALGQKHGELWKIAIKHPRAPELVLAVLPVSNTCVMTSGDYERFFEYEGRRYHHILDPRTGYPATGCISATVTAPDAAVADGLATAMAVMGPERGLELIERLPRIEALLVGMDGTVHASKGLADVRSGAVESAPMPASAQAPGDDG